MDVPYYVKHLLVACLISVVASGVYWLVLLLSGADPSWLDAATPAAGAFFYFGREIRDWEKNGNYGWFDWPGFLWPVVPLMALQVLLLIHRVMA